MRVVLAALSVLLSLLSLPGGGWPGLALISLIPLGLALEGASRVQGFFLGYGCGIAGWFFATEGLIDALSSYAPVSMGTASLIVLLACLWMAIPYGIFGFFCGYWRSINALKAAAGLTALVCLFPNPLPIDSSHALSAFPILIQILDLGGQPLLLFAFYFFNWLLLEAGLRIWRRQSVAAILAPLIGVATLVPGYGIFRLAQYHRVEGRRSRDHTLRVAMIQPNIPLAGEAEPTSEDELNPFRTLLAQTADAFATGTALDLVVWPETPDRITCGNATGVRPELKAGPARYQTPFLINCVQPARDGMDYNTELLVTAGGETLAYHKRTLFAFTEYLPGARWWPGLQSWWPGASRYSAGREAIVFPITNSVRVFPATCYEILFRRQPRDFLRAGGNVLVSAANDAWFGASRIPEFMIAAAVFQAVQYRVPVVRVSNSGNSIALRASGEVLPESRTLPFTKTNQIVEIFAPGEHTIYFRFGDWFLYLLAGALIFWAFKAYRSSQPAAR